MRELTGEQVLVRIFMGEADKWKHRPMHLAILERLRREGFAGATVIHATAGFGARSVLHSTHVLRLSEDLPIILEVVDTQDKVDQLLPILDEMLTEGLVTMEKVRVVRYCPNGHTADE